MNRLQMLILLLLLTVPVQQLRALNPTVDKGFADHHEELFALDNFQGAAAREHENTVIRIPETTGKVWQQFLPSLPETSGPEHWFRKWVWFTSLLLKRFLPVPAIHSP